MIESNQWFPTDQTVSTDYPLIIHCACVDARRASRRRFTRVIRSSRTLTQLCTQSRCPISICQAGNHRVLTIGLRIGCSPLFRPSCVPFVPCRESISSLAARCCLTSNESSLARCCRSHAREIFDWKPLSSREKITLFPASVPRLLREFELRGISINYIVNIVIHRYIYI